jgi:hypothetical protein
MKTLSKLSILTTLTLALGACASNKAEKMDTRLEKSQELQTGQTVGLRDGNVVVQRKVFLAEELRKLEAEVVGLENELYGNKKFGTKGLQGVHFECEKKLADPRVGGNGKLKPLERSERLSDKEEELKFAIDEKEQLVGVSEEMLRDRIERFQGHRKILRERYDEMETGIEVCEQDYKTALINSGLNPEDTKAQGEWVTGPNGYRVWRAKVKATDDPEELSRRKGLKQGAPAVVPVDDIESVEAPTY